VQKQTSVLVLGCISASDMGNLHYCEGNIDMEAYIWIGQRHKLPSRWHLSWEARQCQASFCLCYNWVVSRRSAPQKGCACLFTAVHTYLLWKMYDPSWKRESGNHDNRLLSGCLVSDKIGQVFNSQMI